jgi:uncharacterized repeat protein (TIGR03803 family)
MTNRRQSHPPISTIGWRAASVAWTLAIAFAIAAAPVAQARTFTVLYSFTGAADGGGPFAGLVRDPAGNLYGTTQYGGDPKCGCGTVFKLDPAGKLTVLHSFGGKDGSTPYADLVLDAAGNLYGNTPIGGIVNTKCGSLGCGVIFKMDKSGKESVLYRFLGGIDGDSPVGKLLRDKVGNLYGTTAGGGERCANGGCGTVFKLNKAGKKTLLYRFRLPPDGANPSAGLVRDANGNLYGTTYDGGVDACAAGGCGTLFKVDVTGKETVLRRFTGTDGSNPDFGTLLRDAKGNLYGTTVTGGSAFFGTIFKLDTTRKLTVLYNFSGGKFGANPVAGLVRDAKGNFYGTTEAGGLEGCSDQATCGTVFMRDTLGGVRVLYAFTGNADGGIPTADLILDAADNLYGTASTGGASGKGVIFKIAP